MSYSDDGDPPVCPRCGREVDDGRPCYATGRAHDGAVWWEWPLAIVCILIVLVFVTGLMTRWW